MRRIFRSSSMWKSRLPTRAHMFGREFRSDITRKGTKPCGLRKRIGSHVQGGNESYLRNSRRPTII
jgi:hypothetical protein